MSCILFLAMNTLPFVELTPDLQTASSRLEAAYTLSTQAGLPIIVATGMALLQPLPPRESLAASHRVPGSGRRT